MTEPRASLMLLPGMDGTRVLFRPLLAALPEWLEAQPVAYPTDGRCDYDEALEAALAAFDAMPEGPVHVLGWSFSGPVALRVACARKARVATVTLVASFVAAPLPWLSAAAPLLRTPVVGLVRTLRRLPIWLGRPPDDPLRRDKAELWRTVSARALAARARAIRSVDARDDLVRCPAPLLYVRSSRDRVVPARNLDRIRSLRPDVEVATIPGGHFALHAEAEAGAAAIAAFVRRRGAPTSTSP